MKLASKFVHRYWSSEDQIKPIPRIRRLRGVPYSREKLKATFLSLTQVCQKTRSEFRSLWMREHTIHMRDVQIYIYSFIEHPKMDWKRAFDIFQTSVGILRIHVSECTEIDIVSLLRLKARHLECNIELTSSPEYEHIIVACKLILENRNEQWLRWITNGTVGQARVVVTNPNSPRRYGLVSLHIVLRRRFAETWVGLVGSAVSSVHAIHLTKLGLHIPGLCVSLGIID